MILPLRHALSVTLAVVSLLSAADRAEAQSNPLAGRVIEYQAEYRLITGDGRELRTNNCEGGRIRITQTGVFWEEDVVFGNCGTIDRPGFGYEMPISGSARVNFTCDVRQGQRQVTCSNGFSYRVDQPPPANSRLQTVGTVSAQLGSNSLRMQLAVQQSQPGFPRWSEDRDITFRLTSRGCEIVSWDSVLRQNGALYTRHRLTRVRSCQLR